MPALKLSLLSSPIGGGLYALYDDNKHKEERIEKRRRIARERKLKKLKINDTR
jgi:hypothetical protein